MRSRNDQIRALCEAALSGLRRAARAVFAIVRASPSIFVILRHSRDYWQSVCELKGREPSPIVQNPLWSRYSRAVHSHSCAFKPMRDVWLLGWNCGRARTESEVS